MARLHLKDIRKSFGETRVLTGVSLDIADGEFVSLVGPSGCGKSTLLRIIAGLETQDSGRFEIDEQRVDGVRAADRNLSMVFQSYALYPHLSVGENIAVPLNMRQLNALQRLPVIGPFLPGARGRRRAIHAQVARAAEMLDITHLLGRKPGQLSGGQRQRVAVGRALVREPAAFLLDEPLSNLDAKLRVHMRAEIAQLHRWLGATFIYVTHDQVEAMTMSDRIAVMLDGELLQVGAPSEVYERPADIRVAEFIGSPKINILPAATAADGSIACLGTETRMAVRGAEVRASQLGVRPEGLHLSREPADFTGEILHLENLGPELYVQLRLQGCDAPATLRADAALLPQLAVGQSVHLSFRRDRALAFDNDGKAVETRLLDRTPQTTPASGIKPEQGIAPDLGEERRAAHV
ncbi:ABC transporter ATP-binding protein [Fodinicurvata fenggangensis]|uniref:ABC transporter ATP-binding protein n=1 Tax=Fodinicurvata fenggangensis TaxID=1121830 RepID=UPI0009E0921A|nr:ABC transporter ATP-binding protein [Fodinicurvata fenggangensis]